MKHMHSGFSYKRHYLASNHWRIMQFKWNPQI